jgi:hypothetical protein
VYPRVVRATDSAGFTDGDSLSVHDVVRPDEPEPEVEEPGEADVPEPREEPEAPDVPSEPAPEPGPTAPDDYTAA